MLKNLDHLHAGDRASVEHFAAINAKDPGMIFNTTARPIFALQYLDESDVANHSRICEIDGGACYDVFPTMEAAEKTAARYNADSVDHGWASRYKAVSLPDGIPCPSEILDDRSA